MKRQHQARAAHRSAVLLEQLEPRQLLSGVFAVDQFAANGDMPRFITAGPDGNVWFTNSGANSFAKVTPAGVVTTYTTPKDIGDITTGPDGNLWAASEKGAAIFKINPATGAVTTYNLNNIAIIDPLYITSGPDGALWFAANTDNKIGRITTSGTYLYYDLPLGLTENGPIVAGSDGNLWFTAKHAIGRITPLGVFSTFNLGSNSDPSSITLGQDGNIWFTETNNNKVGRITPRGAVTEFSLPVASSLPDGISTGVDGNLWITQDAGYFASVTTAGVVTEYKVAPNSAADLNAITQGPDGNLWMLDTANNLVDRVILADSETNANPSTVAFSATPINANFGQTVTLTLTITAPYIITAPFGPVTFYNGTTSVGSAIPNANGVAILATTQLGFGTYNLTATFAGDINFTPATAPNTIHITINSASGTGVSVPRYRLYSDVTKEHLYTTDLNEYNTLATRGWTQEGTAYNIYNGPITIDGVAALPYYRLYNGTSQQHLWTTDRNEYDTLRTSGAWNAEGIDGYIFPSAVTGAIPLYRLYLNADGGLHLWTTDLNEYNTLFAEDGWTQEGITGYVIA